MNRTLVSALALASLAVAAACGGGGGGSHTAPIAPATATSGATAAGKIVLMIPNAAPASAGRAPQFVSSAAVSATVSISGGTASVYDLTAASSNCTGGPSARTCTLAITSGSGSITVTIALFDGAGATGHNLGSATGSVTVNAPTPFSLTIDINPAVKLVTSQTLTFANGLPTITYKQAASGTLTVSFADGAVVTIPPTNTSQFQTPVTLTSSDAHVTLLPTTINNASQNVTVTYDGSAAVASTYTITLKTGITTIATITNKTAGFLCEFAVPAGAGSNPNGIAAGSDGNIWFSEGTANNVGRVTLPASCGAPPTINEYPIPTPNTFPYVITAGPPPNTLLWFSEGNGPNIGTIDPAAPVPQESPASAYEGVTAFSNHLWFVNRVGNTLDEFNLAPVFIASSNLGIGCTPEAVAGGPDGMLWVTCFGSNRVYRVDPANVTGAAAWFTAADIQVGIAAGPDSAMWFCEQQIGKIGRISIPGGVFTDYPVPSGAGSQPSFIAMGPDGAMWFTEQVANKIGRIDVTTKQIVEFPTAAAAAPFEITAGPDGWLWFTEYSGGKIGRIQSAF